MTRAQLAAAKVDDKAIGIWGDSGNRSDVGIISKIDGEQIVLLLGKRGHGSFNYRMVIPVKPKRVRREIWVLETDIPKPLYSGHAVVSSAELVGAKYIHFREVGKK